MPRKAPIAGSHSLTVLSWDIEARSWPLGEKTTALTESEWPSSACKEGDQSFSTIGGRSIYPNNSSKNRRLIVLASRLKRSIDL